MTTDEQKGTSAESIAAHCRVILDEIKTGGPFTRRDLEFLLRFFGEIAKTTERMLQ